MSGCIASLFVGVSIAQRSIRQAHLLVMRLVYIQHLTAQCWPNLPWGLFNKTLHVQYYFMYFFNSLTVFFQVDLSLLPNSGLFLHVLPLHLIPMGSFSILKQPQHSKLYQTSNNFIKTFFYVGTNHGTSSIYFVICKHIMLRHHREARHLLYVTHFSSI